MLLRASTTETTLPQSLVLALALRLLFCDRSAVQQYREKQSSRPRRPFPTYFSLAARAVALACALARGWRLGHVWQPLLCGAWARAGGGAGLATAVEEQHAYTNHSCSQEVCEHGAAIKAVYTGGQAGQHNNNEAKLEEAKAGNEGGRNGDGLTVPRVRRMCESR